MQKCYGINYIGRYCDDDVCQMQTQYRGKLEKYNHFARYVSVFFHTSDGNGNVKWEQILCHQGIQLEYSSFYSFFFRDCSGKAVKSVLGMVLE